MRIALLSDCYPPRLGGIETQVRDLGRALSAAGHEVHVFTATPTTGAGHGLRNVAVVREAGVTVHRVTLPLPFSLPVNPLAPSLIRDQLRSFDAAHVHMGVVSPFASDLTDLALDLGLPTAVTWHCVLGAAAVATRRRLGTVGRWADRGAALSAVSAMAARLVARAADRDTPVVVLPNGIDVTHWLPSTRLPAPAPPTVPDSDAEPRVRIVTAMRFAPRKRVRPLLEMLARIHDADPERVRAGVFGDGPLLGPARLTHRGERSWLDLPGRMDQPRLADAYANAGLYLAPTRMEAFGIAALEARTAGLPVVAIRESGVADFITDQVNGLLADDDAGLIAAARRLVADDELRGRIRAHNLATMPAQTWDRVVAQALAEYARAGAR